MNYWLLKTEPSEFSWNDLVKQGTAVWDGVRNFQARNFMAAMKKGDTVMIYHTGKEKQIVGTGIVVREAYPDPTAADDRWLVVDIQALKALKEPFTLEQVKNHPTLQGIYLLRQPRLSVIPLTEIEFKVIGSSNSI